MNFILNLFTWPGLIALVIMTALVLGFGPAISTSVFDAITFD